MQWLSIGEVKKPVNLSKMIKLPHAHLQYVYNILAKYQNDEPKTLGGADFTMHALSA